MAGRWFVVMKLKVNFVGAYPRPMTDPSFWVKNRVSPSLIWVIGTTSQSG